MRLPSLTFFALATATLFLGGQAAASEPATTGLGSSWPNATDVSSSPNYHVYRFERGGVRYIQVNDSAGTVRGAVAYIDDQVLELPIGVDASRWRITAHSPVSTSGESVYRDGTISIQITSNADGTARMMLDSTCNDPAVCSKRDP